MNSKIIKRTIKFLENEQPPGDGGDAKPSVSSANDLNSGKISNSNISDDEELLENIQFAIPPLNIVTNLGPYQGTSGVTDGIEQKKYIEGITTAASSNNGNTNPRNLSRNANEGPTTSVQQNTPTFSRQVQRQQGTSQTPGSDPIVIFHLRSRTAAINEEMQNVYESLDYNICESVLYQKEHILRPHGEMRNRIFRWIIFIIIGTLTALIACFNDIIIEELTAFKFRVVTESINANILNRPGENLIFPYLFWLGLSIIPVAIGTLLVTFVEPAAAGSGIPQVKCYLNGVKIHRFLRLKTLIVKNSGLIAALVGGMTGGKEGPMAHSGAIIAAGVSQGKSTTLNKDFGFFKAFRTDQEKRDFVLGGAAAGVAAAFGSPIGGMLFSLEEAASFWNQNLIWRTLIASILSAFTLNIVLSYYHGLQDLTFRGLFNLGKFENTVHYEYFELPIFVLLGIIGGLLGSFWNMINTKINRYRARFVKYKFAKFTEALMITILGVSIACAMVYFLSDCRPLDDDLNKNIQLFCEDNEYNAVATLWFSTPEGIVKSLFHDSMESYSILTLSVFTLSYYLLACLTYGLSVSLGVFIPTVLIGAAWGRLVAKVLMSLFPQATFFNAGKYALIGSAGHLGGVLRMTISLSVILLDTTGVDTEFFFPLIITLTSAKWVGDYFNEGLFDITIRDSHVPILPWEPEPQFIGLKAEQIMSSPVVCFNIKEKAKHIYDVLKSCKHNGFPVVENVTGEDRSNGQLSGIILREQLVVILLNSFYEEKKRFWIDDVSIEVFRNIYPRVPSIDEVQLHEDKIDYTVNLEIFMDPSPFCSWKHDGVPKIFRKFRALGLRHLVVIDNHNRVNGIITRKDFLNK